MKLSLSGNEVFSYLGLCPIVVIVKIIIEIYGEMCFFKVAVF